MPEKFLTQSYMVASQGGKNLLRAKTQTGLAEIRCPLRSEGEQSTFKANEPPQNSQNLLKSPQNHIEQPTLLHNDVFIKQDLLANGTMNLFYVNNLNMDQIKD